MKYRKVVLDKRVEKAIVESMKGFNERYAIEVTKYKCRNVYPYGYILRGAIRIIDKGICSTIV